MVDGKIGPREASLLDQARSFVRAGDDANVKGEPPWFYYAKASELAKGLPAARLADALEEALNRLAVLVGCAEIILSDGPHEPDRKQIDRLRSVLAEADRG